jgi:hypothetical protein
MTDRLIEYERPPLYPKQYAALFDPHRYSVIEASTKAGKTSAALVWLIEKALAGSPGQQFWWISPVYNQATDVFNRAMRAIPLHQRTANLADLQITLFNGAVIWFRTGERPDALYGADVYAAVIDEATRVREESFYAIRSTLTATRGPLRIIGNVKGRRNWAYRMAREAEQGDPDMGYHKLTAHDAIAAGVLADAEIEDARRRLPDAIFRELYLAEPSDDQGNPFGLSQIKACIAPLSGQKPYVWGWDLAKHTDYTVGLALDRQGRVCEFERWQSDWALTVPRILAATGSAKALVDATGVGDPIIEMLQRSNRNFEGYKFTSTSKQQLMEGLAVAIQTKAVRFPEGPIVFELEQFTYEVTRTGTRYTAEDGMHDDCVCALALAVMHMNRAPSYDSTLSWVGAPHADEEFKAFIETGVPPPPRVEQFVPPPRTWQAGRGWSDE